MKLLTKNVGTFLKCSHGRKYCVTPKYIYPTEADEHTPTPNYPPIPVIDPESEESQKKSWYDKIKRQLTVEEKLLEINVPRRWGWKCLVVREGQIPFDNLAFAQHMTKTHIIQSQNLPEFYNKSLEESKHLANELKGDVVDAIENQINARRQKLSEISDPLSQEKEMTRFIATELNRILMNSIWDKKSFLKSLQIDFTPRVEASWKIESMVETFVKPVYEYGLPPEEIPEEYLERPSDKYIQYFGCPILQVRSVDPLPPIMESMEANILNYSVPTYNYDPHYILGYELDRRYLNNIPGFWPGEEGEFSFISYHSTNHLKYRPPTYGPEDTRDALYSQAAFASFGWLLPLAYYHGFTCFHDTTYPFVNQTILTDGREFTFAPYQLNTTEMHSPNAKDNVKCNVCWIVPNKPLYEAIENGKLKGFNENVLGMLIQFYINEPKAFENITLKPYLGSDIKHSADYEDDEKATWLDEKFKRCCTNRHWSKSSEMYEVMEWEKIYKIMFRMRPRDPRRRPFELRQNPYLEKLSDSPPEYIPKKLRPDKDLPKWKQRKYRRSFFPK